MSRGFAVTAGARLGAEESEISEAQWDKRLAEDLTFFV